jgi:hypothetical protein
VPRTKFPPTPALKLPEDPVHISCKPAKPKVPKAVPVESQKLDPAPGEKPKTLHTFKYGYRSTIPVPEWTLEATAFCQGRTPANGGLGRFQHLYNWLSLTWPKEIQPDRWNPWTERTIRALCSDEDAQIIGSSRVKVTCLTGNAAASKTHTAGMYAFCYWACSPHNTIVMITSTTKGMVKSRIWPVIQHMHDTARTGDKGDTPWKAFNKVDSQTTIKFIPQGTDSSNEKNAIFGMAVDRGELQKSAARLRGLHDTRMLLIIDEANATPEAIFETIPNQLKGCQNHEIIVIGNPISHMDAHGQACTPSEGWSIVTESRHQWRTKGVQKWELAPGTCLRFDGKESPNVKLGRDQWPFLFTCADWYRACAPDKERTLAYWSQSRGLWPPDGFCNTILSEAMLEKYDPVNGLPFRWLSHRAGVAFLDSGFGGDACKLGFAEFGDIEGGKTGVQILEILEIQFDIAEKSEVIDYIIARRCIQECKRRGIASNCFGLDRTGTGRGVAAIICAEWADDIVQVEYGSVATERPSSTADGRPSREIYFNRVCEMHWSLREFLEAGQLRGIPIQARVELSTREYSMVGRRYKLESKEDYKKRVSTHSPDDGDDVTGIVDVVRMRGITARTANTESTNTTWEHMIETQVQASEEDLGQEKPSFSYAPSGITDMFDNGLEPVDWSD